MKNIIAVISAIFVSLLLGYAFMGVSKEPQENVTPVMSESNTIKAFQVGAFTSKETAEKEALSKSGKVITDGQYYYVYVAILSDQENIDKMINYLDEKNYYYYLKNINLSSEFKIELSKYEELMKQTTSHIAFLELNKRVLEMYEV